MNKTRTILAYKTVPVGSKLMSLTLPRNLKEHEILIQQN